MIKSWQPWKRSTGAKTPEGKAVSKMNAIKHGGYTSTSMTILNQIKKLLNRKY
jgi:hypothetical protein